MTSSPSPFFDPTNWYWEVATDKTRLWSSHLGTYIQVADAAYADWLETGAVPTRILNEQELTDVLAPYGLKGPYVSTNPADYPLRPDQFFAMLDIAGLTASVTAAVDAIADPKTKAIAKAKLNHTSSFHRDNPLFETLKSGVGVTDAQIDAMWMQAKDIP